MIGISTQPNAERLERDELVRGGDATARASITVGTGTVFAEQSPQNALSSQWAAICRRAFGSSHSFVARGTAKWKRVSLDEKRGQVTINLPPKQETIESEDRADALRLLIALKDQGWYLSVALVIRCGPSFALPSTRDPKVRSRLKTLLATNSSKDQIANALACDSPAKTRAQTQTSSHMKKKKRSASGLPSIDPQDPARSGKVSQPAITAAKKAHSREQNGAQTIASEMIHERAVDGEGLPLPRWRPTHNARKQALNSALKPTIPDVGTREWVIAKGRDMLRSEKSMQAAKLCNQHGYKASILGGELDDWVKKKYQQGSVGAVLAFLAVVGECGPYTAVDLLRRAAQNGDDANLLKQAYLHKVYEPIKTEIDAAIVRREAKGFADAVAWRRMFDGLAK